MKFVLKRFPFKIDEQYLSISNPIVKIQPLKRTNCFKVISSQFLLLINVWKCNCFVKCNSNVYYVTSHYNINLCPLYIFCKECFTGILNEYILPNSKKICNIINNSRLFTTSIAVGILRENYFKHNNSKHANQVFVHIKSSKNLNIFIKVNRQGTVCSRKNLRDFCVI